MPEKFNREDVRKEAERIDMFDESIDHKVKGVGEQLARKYTLGTISLADKIERSEIHEEDKQQLLKEIKTELSTLKTRRSLKKREEDFNKKLDSWINEVESGEKLRGELTKFIEENKQYLPIEKIAKVDLKNTPTKNLKTLKEEIETNKKEFESFKEIQKILPKELSEDFLHICFIKYLSNGKKPKIPEVIAGLKEAVKQQEEIVKVQEETMKIARKFQEIEVSEENLQEETELIFLLSEMINSGDAKGSVQKLELEKALDQEKKNQEKVKRMIKLTEAEKEMREAKEKKDILEKQLKYFKIIQEELVSTAEDAEKSFSELLSETTDKEKQKLYLTQLIAIKKDFGEKETTIQKQIENVEFALNNMEAENNYLNELMDANKNLSEEAKDFAVKKAEFLGEKINDLKEREDGIEEERKSLVKTIKEEKLEEKYQELRDKYGIPSLAYEENRLTPEERESYEKLESLSKRDTNLIRDNFRIKAEKTYLELEQKAANNNFEPREWMEFFKKNRSKNPDLGEKARMALNLYTPRYLKDFESIKNVTKNLLPLHNNLGNIYAHLDKASDRNLSQETLDFWNSTLGKAKDEFLQKEMWRDVQRGGSEILSLIAIFKANGFNDSEPIMGTLQQMKENYENLQSLYGHDQCEFVRITEKIADLEADTTMNNVTNFLKTEGVMIGGAVIGATLFAIPGGMIAGAAGLGAVSEFILVSTCAGVGMTLGTEVSKPMIGMVPDFSIKNLAYSSAKNTLNSMLFMGAGKLIGREIGAVIKAGTGGRVANGIYWAKQGIDKTWGTVKGAGATLTNKNAVARYVVGNIFQEGSEEVGENLSQKVDPKLGLIASAFNSMDGINVNLDISVAPAMKTLSKEAEVSIRSIKGNKVVFEFNPENKQVLIDKLTQSGGTMINKGAVLTCEFYQGKEKITYRFNPSKVPFKTRQFLATDVGKSLERKFKLESKEEGHTEYMGSKESLQAHLEAEGFVCLEIEGRIVAVRNKERVVFVPQAKKPGLGKFVGEITQSAKGLFMKPAAELRSMSRAHSNNEAALANLSRAVPAHVVEEASVSADRTIESVENLPGLNLEEKKVLIELFPEGIESSHIRQENIGNCHFLAALHAAKKSPLFPYFIAKNVRKEVTDSGEVKWHVKLTNDYAETETIVVGEELLVGGIGYDEDLEMVTLKQTVAGQKGDKVLDMALTGLFYRNGNKKVEHVRDAMDGGWPTATLYAMFCFEGETFQVTNRGKKGTEKPFNKGLIGAKKKTEEVRAKLTEIESQPDENIVAVATPCGQYRTKYFEKFHYNVSRNGKSQRKEKIIYYMDPQHRFVTGHAYSLVGVDTKNETVTISNPHGTKDKTYTIKFEEFFEYFSYMGGMKLEKSSVSENYGETRLMGKNYFEGKYDLDLEKGVPHLYSLNDGSIEIDSGGQKVTVHRGHNGEARMKKNNPNGSGLRIENGEIVDVGNGKILIKLGDKDVETRVTKTENNENFEYEEGKLSEDLSTEKGYEFDITNKQIRVIKNGRSYRINKLTNGSILFEGETIGKGGNFYIESEGIGVKNDGNGKIKIYSMEKGQQMRVLQEKITPIEDVKGALNPGEKYFFNIDDGGDVDLEIGDGTRLKVILFGKEVRTKIIGGGDFMSGRRSLDSNHGYLSIGKHELGDIPGVADNHLVIRIERGTLTIRNGGKTKVTNINK